MSSLTASWMTVEPVTLDGEHVRLEPLASCHAADLFEASQDESIWRWMPQPMPASLEVVEAMIANAQPTCTAETQRRFAVLDQIPFAVIHKESGKAVGSSRYLDIQLRDRGLEIGWTWYGVAVQRTVVNTECKYLLLRYAFETLGAYRVQLKTDGRNERSQRAITRIGAKYEGTLRRHRLCWDGHVRDSVYFSILDAEWPEVKAGLEAKLEFAPA